MPKRYDVFLSYSRAEESAVKSLAHKLKAPFSVFLDKWNLIPGDPWQEALEQALDESQACAVFVGRGGIGPWQNEEMRSALEDRVGNQSIRVIPVLLPGALEDDKAKLPRFLRRLSWVDFRSGLEDEETFRLLVCGIEGRAPGPDGNGGATKHLHSPFRSMAPAPDVFVSRREYETVLEALCSPQAGATVGITTALRGAGGFGKTALAMKVCSDPRVQETFPDGILWATMGETLTPDGRIEKVRELVRWWIDEDPPSFTSLEGAGAKLREVLAGQRVLIVVDDVWSPSDLTPFKGLHAEAIVLTTTRDRQTLPTGAHTIDVDAMVPAEALKLLRLDLPQGSDARLTDLARRLGEWPLLLTLVNGQLRDLVQELSLDDALRYVEEALVAGGVNAFNQGDPTERNRAAARTLAVSLDRLSPEERDRYERLAIFPEDADVPLAPLEKLWGLSLAGARGLCKRLHDASLLLRFDLKNGTIRLHDVFRSCLLERCKEDLPALHRGFLDASRPKSGRWADLPKEEAYLWRNLAHHLDRETLRDLLFDFDYLRAKLEATDVNALIADCAPLAEDGEVRAIQGALRLSAHVLGKDKRQLAGQLLGRLLSFEGPRIQSLLQEVDVDGPWLRPRTRGLTTPGGALIRTLEGHTAGVTAVAVVNGRRAVSGSFDGTLQVWDLDTGGALSTLKAHTSGVSVVTVVDGRRAVSGSFDGTLRLWNLDTGEYLRTLEGHTLGVTMVAVVDGRRAVSSSFDGTLRVWNLDTGENLRTLEGHARGVTAVAVVDGRRAVSGSLDGTLRVWDFDTGESLRTLEGHTHRVTAVTVLDGCRAISGSFDGTLRVWNLDTGEYLRTLEAHDFSVTAVAVVDSCRFVTGSDTGMLRVWDLDTGEYLRTLRGHMDRVTAVAVVDGRRAVSGSTDGTLRVWDLDTEEALLELEGHAHEVTAVAMADGRRAVSVSSDQMLRVWDLDTSKALRTLKGHTNRVTAVAVVVDGWRAISGSADGTHQVWNLDTGEALSTGEHTHWVCAVAVVDGRRAISGFFDGTLQVWDLDTGKALHNLVGHPDTVCAVAVVDSRRAVSGSSDRTLRVWDLDTGEVLRSLKGHTGVVNAVAVMDDRCAISGSEDGTLRVWDLDAREALRTLEGHTAGVKAVAVVDGRRAISGSDDRTLRVWDLETGEVLAVMTLDAPVLAVAVGREGRIVVAGDRLGRVHFFDWVDNRADCALTTSPPGPLSQGERGKDGS